MRYAAYWGVTLSEVSHAKRILSTWIGYDDVESFIADLTWEGIENGLAV